MKDFSLNHLTDTEFEQFCYDLLIELKFINLNWRKGTGFTSSPSDHGRDIECQLPHEDIDGSIYLEKWFVECKHYQQGVPPDKLQGALAWATAERPDKLLIIASNFLSNPTKDFLVNYTQNVKPSFRTKYWEKPDLERLSRDKPIFLKKYKLLDNPEVVKEYVEFNFIKEYINFEAKLRLILLTLKIDIPRSHLGSARAMWRFFARFAGDVDPHHTAVVERANNVRNKYMHGEEVLCTAEEFEELTSKVKFMSDYISGYTIATLLKDDLR